MIISVIGSGNPEPDIYALAEDVGKELGKRGVTVVCGGMGGVMEAVCKGAKARGGHTIGILPGDDPNQSNQWVDYPICTGLKYARNVIVVKSGRSVIAIGGAFGTLSEIGHALAENIPTIGLKTWKMSRNGVEEKAVQVATDPVDAVDKAINAARQRNLMDVMSP